MKKKLSLTLDDEFLQYCELNQVKNPSKLAKETFERGFSILKFGETPSIVKGREVVKEIEKEVIKEVKVEVIKEVPVEVIKEVERVVEKEVYITDDEQVKELGGKIAELEKELKKKPKEIEKIVTVTDDDEIMKLKEENDKLKEELDKITSSLSNLNKAKYLKNSNLNSLYDE